jgi:hypothetical protein
MIAQLVEIAISSLKSVVPVADRRLSGRCHGKGEDGMDHGSADHILRAQGVSLRFDPACGMLRDFEVDHGGDIIRPMHRVPWANETIPSGLPAHLDRMEGDFFCAPFGDGGGAAPVLHGWPANGDWRVIDDQSGDRHLTAVLMRDVQGARLTKRLRVEDGHPFLYQTHVFEGGEGVLSAGNHAMVSLPHGGLISMSPKSAFETPSTAPEPDGGRGRSALAYPGTTTDAEMFPTNDGGTADLTRYPFRPRHEDFVVATEAAASTLGWTAIARLGTGSLFLSLRDHVLLPMTMLWHSDGGRDYAPWLGRHRACLGVEEGFAPHMLGRPGGLALGARLVIRHAIGAVAWPTEERVAAIVTQSKGLRIRGERGAAMDVSFDSRHVGASSQT